MFALEVRDVTKCFGPLKAVDGASFGVRDGEICGFIGPNGAGKTTTMRMCATLELPDQGDILVEGLSVLVEPRQVRQRLGFMPDAYGAYLSTTIYEYLDFFARAYGLRGAKRRDTVDRVLDFTSLDTIPDKEISSLSKGMKQRLCLAKTLLHDPRVMILDEPAAGLDPRARVELRELVRALAELGKAILISSHILTELSEMCDSVVVIESGRIQAHGKVEAITQELRTHTQIFVRTLSPLEDVERALLEQPFVESVRREGDGVLFEFEGEADDIARLLETLVKRELRPVEFRTEALDLEDLFLSLTEGKMR